MYPAVCCAGVFSLGRTDKESMQDEETNPSFQEKQRLSSWSDCKNLASSEEKGHSKKTVKPVNLVGLKLGRPCRAGSRFHCCDRPPANSVLLFKPSQHKGSDGYQFANQHTCTCGVVV